MRDTEFERLNNQPSPDEIVERVVAHLRRRSIVGVEKYGTTLKDSPESIVARLRHLQQETLDASNYIEWAIDWIEQYILPVVQQSGIVGEPNALSLEQWRRRIADVQEKNYWKERCEAAERVINESPCDPDITSNQIKAINVWEEIKNREI